MKTVIMCHPERGGNVVFNVTEVAKREADGWELLKGEQLAALKCGGASYENAALLAKRGPAEEPAEEKEPEGDEE